MRAETDAVFAKLRASFLIERLYLVRHGVALKDAEAFAQAKSDAASLAR